MGSVHKDPTGFSTSFTATYEADPTTEFFFHKIELADRYIINVQINGAMDSTYELPVSSKTLINHQAAINLETDEVEPRLVVGNHSNLKVQIVAAQIGKLIAASQNPKDTVLSIGSKWFGRGDVPEETDFGKLMFVLGNVKKLL